LQAQEPPQNKQIRIPQFSHGADGRRFLVRRIPAIGDADVAPA
jgi:hypothetical protein